MFAGGLRPSRDPDLRCRHALWQRESGQGKSTHIMCGWHIISFSVPFTLHTFVCLHLIPHRLLQTSQRRWPQMIKSGAFPCAQFRTSWLHSIRTKFDPNKRRWLRTRLSAVPSFRSRNLQQRRRQDGGPSILSCRRRRSHARCKTRRTRTTPTGYRCRGKSWSRVGPASLREVLWEAQLRWVYA